MESISQFPRRRWTKKHVLLIASPLLVIAALAALAIGPGLIEATNTVILALRVAGPVVFFLAMAFLPALGFPLLAFTLAAGPVFGPALGTGGVIAWSLGAVLVNLLLTHWLSHRALRPLVSRLLARFDFRLPESAAGDAWQLTLIVRLTPGPPFWVQSYLLGLLRVPLVPYLIVSLLVMTGYIVALISGAEALANGNGRLAFAAVGVLVVTVAGLQLWRHRTARRQAAAALPVALGPTVVIH